MLDKIKNFLNDESGLTTAEIAIIGGLFAAAAAGLGAFLVPKIKAAGERMGKELEDSAGVQY